MTEKEALLWVLGILGSLCAAAITIDKVLDIIHKYIKKAQVFAALRGALPDLLKPFITDEVLDSVIEKAVSMMKKALAEKKPTINKE